MDAGETADWGLRPSARDTCRPGWLFGVSVRDLVDMCCLCNSFGNPSRSGQGGRGLAGYLDIANLPTIERRGEGHLHKCAPQTSIRARLTMQVHGNAARNPTSTD